MKKQSFLIAAVLICGTTIYFACKEYNSLLQVALGQAEEIFGENATFMYELEQAQKQIQTEMPPDTDVSQARGDAKATLTSAAPFRQPDNSQNPNTFSSTEPEVPKQIMLASANNLYTIWETNETGNWEVMFRASNDNGETFSEKINLSNSTKTDSKRPEVTASQSNVFIAWQEESPSNKTIEYVLRISPDEGRTFGPALQLSGNGAIDVEKLPLDVSSYENSEHRMRLRYPSGWEVINGSNANDGSVIKIAGVVSPFEYRLDKYRENIWMYTDNLRGENLTLVTYSLGLADYKRETLNNFQLLDFNTDSNILAGRQAYRLVYGYTIEDGTTIKEMEIGTKIDDKVYYLQYSAEEKKYSDLFPVINDIVDSFEILNNRK